MFDIFSKKCCVFSFGELQKLFFRANISSWSYSWPKFSFSLKCLPLNNKALTMQRMKSCPHLVRGLLWVFLCWGPLRDFLCQTIPTDNFSLWKQQSQLSCKNATTLGWAMQQLIQVLLACVRKWRRKSQIVSYLSGWWDLSWFQQLVYWICLFDYIFSC